jgi:hypothetical protein
VNYKTKITSDSHVKYVKHSHNIASNIRLEIGDEGSFEVDESIDRGLDDAVTVITERSERDLSMILSTVSLLSVVTLGAVSSTCSSIRIML